jgi:hypothetical protein
MTQLAAEQDVAMQRLDRELTLVRRVRSAIDRVKDGTYGICLQCEEEIAPKRLRAIPWAELCIHCQEIKRALSASSKQGSRPARPARRKATSRIAHKIFDVAGSSSFRILCESQ